MQRIFRPQLRYWLIEVLPISFFVGIAVAAPYMLGRKFVLVPAGGLLLFYFLVIFCPALRTHITIDPQGITGRVEHRSFQVSWSDVVVADLHAADSFQPWLVLGTAQGIEQISLLGMEVQTLWQIVQERVGSAALEEAAYRQLPEYRELADQNIRWLDTTKAWHVRERVALLVLWLCTAFFTCITIVIWDSPPPWARWVGLGMAVLGGYFPISMMGTIDVDAFGMAHTGPVASIRVCWDEVDHVILAAGADSLDVYGKKRRLSLFQPSWWSNKERRGIISMVEIICQVRGIDFQVEQGRK